MKGIFHGNNLNTKVLAKQAVDVKLEIDKMNEVGKYGSRSLLIKYCNEQRIGNQFQLLLQLVSYMIDERKSSFWALG